MPDKKMARGRGRRANKHRDLLEEVIGEINILNSLQNYMQK